MIEYKLQKNRFGEVVAVTIIGQNISIPFDPQNSDYIAYLKWIEEGNVPTPADEL
jgi:hypothetical protein